MIEPVRPDDLPPSRGTGARADAGPDAVSDSDFTVHLDRVFHGPLDLLLQLVRDKELEIHVVSLAEVCDAYCRHIRELPEIPVDEAADYLVIAATLLAIKSKSLLPTEEVDFDEDPFDPGEELVAQLLAYKELRQTADVLAERWEARKRLLPAGGKWLGRFQAEEEEEEDEWDLGDLSVWDLLKLISRLDEETGFLRPHQVRPAGRPLRAYVQEVWERLQEVARTSLLTLLRDGNHGRSDAAYYLVALLELAKQQQVDLKQRDCFDDIHVQRSENQELFNLDAIDAQFDEDPTAAEPEVDELLHDGTPPSS